MCAQPFHNRGELDEMAIHLFEEVVKLQRIIDIIVVHYSHCVVFHLVFLQQVDPFHHFEEGGKTLAGAAVFVVKLLRAVYRDADKEIIFFEETAPFVCKQLSICRPRPYFF